MRLNRGCEARAAAPDQRVPFSAVCLSGTEARRVARGGWVDAGLDRVPLWYRHQRQQYSFPRRSTDCPSWWKKRRYQRGRYLRYPQDTPLANLHVTILEKLGVPVEAFGDSTGGLDRLTGV